MRIFSIAAIILTACNSKEEEDTASEEVVEAEETTEEVEDAEADACADLGVEGIRLEGTIRYPDGTLGCRDNTRVHMCSGAGCSFALWGDSGFCYPEGSLEPGVYSFKVVPFGFEGHATPLSVITIRDEDKVLSKEVNVPEFTHQTDLMDGKFNAGNGMEIDIVAENYTPSLPNEEFVAAVSVDFSESGLPVEGIEHDRIFAMWYLGSFDASISPKWGFEVKDTGLEVGTTLQILNASYYDQKWEIVGSATVDDDGVLRTDDDSGIANLTTVILLSQ